MIEVSMIMRQILGLLKCTDLSIYIYMHLFIETVYVAYIILK